MVDNIKAAVALALLAAGIAAFYYFGEAALILRVLAVLAGAVAGGVVFLLSAPGQQFRAFAEESITETRKVVWPTRKETLQTTGIVFAFMVVMAIFLWLVDAGLVWVVKLLIGRSEA